MNLRRANPSMQRAFTLLEVLIAISIFAVLIGAIGSVFYAALRLRNNANRQLEECLPIEDALEAMQYDLANLVAPTGSFFGPLQTANPTNMLQGQIGPDFYVSTGQLDGMTPWGNVERLDFILAVHTNGTAIGKDLYRAATRNLLPVSPQTAPDESRLLLTGVENLTFLYYDGQQWQPTWDTTTQTNLPVAIKVQIQMAAQPAQGAAPNSPLELVIPIDILLNTNATASLP